MEKHEFTTNLSNSLKQLINTLSKKNYKTNLEQIIRVSLLFFNK
jgi:hypothetical protein